MITNIDVGDLGVPPAPVASPDGRFLYLINAYTPSNKPTLFVISTASNAVVKTVTWDGFFEYLLMSPDGRFLYLIDSSRTQVMCALSYQLLATISIGIPLSIENYATAGPILSPDGQLLQLPRITGVWDDVDILIVDTSSKRRIADIPISEPHAYGSTLSTVKLTPDGRSCL